MRPRTTKTLVSVALATLLATTAQAQSVAEFYRGKTINMVIGYTVGGVYDLYARTLSRFMGKHIPGNPAIVPQNMAGAGSLKAANYIYNVAPKDGLSLVTFARGLPMEPLIGSSEAQFEAAKFTWIGSGTNEMSVCATWHTSQVKTWDDMLQKSFTVGGEGSGSDPDIFSAILKNTFGVKLKMVSGYPGGNEISLAMERGEVDGRCGWSWSSIKAAKPDWIRDKKLNLMVQLAMTKSPELPNVPLIADVADDRQRQILQLVMSRQVMGRPFAAAPGIPDDRKAALRKAFDDTMKDPEFLAEAQKLRLDVNPVSGADIEKLIYQLYQTPKDVIAETRAAVAKGSQ
jgi:tripartite-type tricarboxylate transporter receptor subunit TctC